MPGYIPHILHTPYYSVAEQTAKSRSEVLTAMVMMSSVFWDITPCSPLEINRRFGGTFRLLLLPPYSSTVKVEASCSSETSVDFQLTTRRCIPEGIIDLS
jgi:hypothetical protein